MKENRFSWIRRVLPGASLRLGKLRIKRPFLLCFVYWLLLYYDSSGFLRVGLTVSLWHELGHIACYFLLYRRIPELTLSLAGISLRQGAEPADTWQVLLLAASGPAANFAAALFFYAAMTERATVLRAAFWAANLLIGSFNLLPVPPLDGYRILACLLDSWMDKLQFH